MTLAQGFALGRSWWGDRLDADWQPRTPERAQAMLAEVGLDGPFWTVGEFA